ncbi:MAG TPA: pilus assembly protein N-terminal domain-containing protein [Vicinamibacterales bacterium]
MRSGRRAAKVIALVVYIIVILVATPQAQQRAAFTSGAPGAITAGTAPVASDTTVVELLVGRSTILNVSAPISRVSLTVPDIADAMVTTPQQLLIHGKTPGTISLFVWDRAGGITTYEVNVRRDLSQLIDQMKQLFPGEPITVTGSGKDVIISGTVSSKYVIDKAADVASGYVEKKENVVNLLKQQEGVASNQVLLRVRFAEVSRSALQELGGSLILDQFKKDMWDARATTQQFAAPSFDSSKPGQLDFSDFLNLFVFNSKQGVGAVVRALSSKGLFQSLAEPNLIALNGKEASFLAGGEYPYPVVQPNGTNNAITILFKEFGVRLSFTPTVLGNDLIDLKLRPEVSTLDFTNAIVLDGFRVPALSTRRTETEVELQDGQTFAVAGLLNNTLNNTMQKIPGIGDIPVLGYLFKSRAYQKDQSELVVMITPTILRRGSTGASEGLPSLVEPYLPAPSKTYPAPPPYTGSPRFPANQPQRRSGGSSAPQSNVPQTSNSAHPQNNGSAQVQSAVNAVSQTVESAQSQSASEPSSVPARPVAAMPEPGLQNAAQPAAAAATAPDPKALKAQQTADRRAAQDQEAASRKAAADKAVADKEAAKQKAAADKKASEEKAAADKKAAEDKARQDKLDAERAKREAEVAKKNADEQKKQDKAIADAAARLKAAQAAYQAEIDKKSKDNKGGQ